MNTGTVNQFVNCSPWKVVLLLTAVATSVLSLAVGTVNAADQGITGKKLLLKGSPKMVLLSRDALVLPGANGSTSDPRCVADGGSGSGASVTLDDGTNSATLTMPCANWSANGAGTLYKYKDAAGTPKVGKLKAGLLNVIGPGMGGFSVPNGAATVNVEMAVGTDRYCMTFTGAGDGIKFLVKDAAPGTCPPVIVPCGDSEYPTCGGSCPDGEVCQAMADVTVTGTPPGCGGVISSSTSCGCVPEAGTCTGQHALGICIFTDIPFDQGPCPFDGVCFTVTSTLSEMERKCGPQDALP